MQFALMSCVLASQVPALIDNEGRFALEEKDNFKISAKPHGHGDIHMLMHQSGVAAKWAAEGRRYLLFFQAGRSPRSPAALTADAQDTNAIVFHALPAAVGVSVKNRHAKRWAASRLSATSTSSPLRPQLPGQQHLRGA